ncbi:hypothetical protein, partial [Bacillus altitudinis]
DEHNIDWHFSNRHNDHMDYGLHRAFKFSKKEGRKRKQPQKTHCTRVCGHFIHRTFGFFTHSEYPAV